VWLLLFVATVVVESTVLDLPWLVGLAVPAALFALAFVGPPRPDRAPVTTGPPVRGRWVLGNHVVVDHGDGVWSAYAHLRRGRLAVALARGDRARRGRRQPVTGDRRDGALSDVPENGRDFEVAVGG
jgi:hypothetical protein